MNSEQALKSLTLGMELPESQEQEPLPGGLLPVNERRTREQIMKDFRNNLGFWESTKLHGKELFGLDTAADDLSSTIREYASIPNEAQNTMAELLVKAIGPDAAMSLIEPTASRNLFGEKVYNSEILQDSGVYDDLSLLEALTINNEDPNFLTSLLSDYITSTNLGQADQSKEIDNNLLNAYFNTSTELLTPSF